MTSAEKKIGMAYAMGYTMAIGGRLELKNIVPEWDRFELTARKGTDNTNGSWALYIDGENGRETWFSRILNVHEGWELDHAIHLLISAIDCRKAELKE